MKKIECIICHTNLISFYKAAKGYICVRCLDDELEECAKCGEYASHLDNANVPLCEECVDEALSQTDATGGGKKGLIIIDERVCQNATAQLVDIATKEHV